jgi:RimJ/RimL family protein N-acetyltransferase
MFRDPGIWWYEYDRGLNRAETVEFLDRQLELWDDYAFGGCAVRDLTAMRLLGVVGLGVPALVHAALPLVTVGWRFASTAWGHGYATETATALLHQAFGPMRIDAVGCVTDAQNARSIAVARRLGMNVVGEQEVAMDGGAGSAVALILAVDREAWNAVEKRDENA